MRGAAGTITLVAALLFTFCAPTRFVKPLEEKQQALAGSFGGPLIKFGGAPIPIPFTTLTYGYGATSRATLYGSLHTTSLLFGNLQFDAGATIGLLKAENKNGLSISPALQFAANRGNGRLWPSLDLNYYRHVGTHGSFMYGGAGSWFEFSAKRAHGEVQSRRLLPAFHAGFTRARDKWQQQIELKYLAPGADIWPGVVDYIGLNGQGAFGFYVSFCRKF